MLAEQNGPAEGLRALTEDSDHPRNTQHHCSRLEGSNPCRSMRLLAQQCLEDRSSCREMSRRLSVSVHFGAKRASAELDDSGVYEHMARPPQGQKQECRQGGN